MPAARYLFIPFLRTKSQMRQMKNWSSKKSHKRKTDRTNILATNFIWEQLKNSNAILHDKLCAIRLELITLWPYRFTNWLQTKNHPSMNIISTKINSTPINNTNKKRIQLNKRILVTTTHLWLNKLLFFLIYSTLIINSIWPPDKKALSKT